MKRESRARQRAAATRHALLTAARSLVAELGLDAVTIQAITDRADVAVGSLYYHFGNRDELFRELVRTEGVLFTEEAEHFLADGADLAGAGVMLLAMTLNRGQTDPEWAGFIAAMADSEYWLEVGQAARLATLVQRGVDQGLLSVENIELAAEVVRVQIITFLRVLSGASDVTAEPTEMISLTLRTLGADEETIRRAPVAMAASNG